MSLQGATLREVLELIAEISKRNVVLFDEAKNGKHVFDLEVKDKPWDTLLSDVLKASGLTKDQQDSVIFIGTREQLMARKPYGGTDKRLTVELSGARVGDVVPALRIAGAKELPEVKGGTLQTRKLRNLPADYLVSLLSEVSGASVDAPLDQPPLREPDGEPPCAASEDALQTLQLTVVVSGVANPSAVARTPDGRTFLLRRKDCVGREREQVKQILRDSLITTSSWRLKLGGPAEPPAPDVNKLEDP